MVDFEKLVEKEKDLLEEVDLLVEKYKRLIDYIFVRLQAFIKSVPHMYTYVPTVETNSVPKPPTSQAKSKEKKGTPIEGIVKGETEKALLLSVKGKEGWVPKSKIISGPESYSKDTSYKFTIESWIYKRSFAEG